MNEIIERIICDKQYNLLWTTAIEGKPVKKKGAEENQICLIKCKDKDCLNSLDLEFLCKHNLSSFNANIKGVRVTVYGYQGDKTSLSRINKLYKNSCKGRKLKRIHFNNWIESLRLLITVIDDKIEEKSSDVLHYFHDPVKWATQASIQAESLISKSKGNGFFEKFNNSTNEVKAIYKTTQMLVDSIGQIKIFFNPESASFGELKKTSIYRLFDKVQAIVFHAEGKKVNRRFRLKGGSYNEIFLYESFSIIALSLIQNAVKYSKSSEIDILIEDLKGGVNVEVSSLGILISDKEKNNLFNKGYRGKYAKRLHHDGMGIGLYISQKIANIHGFSINVESVDRKSSQDSMPLAYNTFSFFVSEKIVRKEIRKKQVKEAAM